MSQLIEIPLNTGMDQGADRVYQDAAVLTYAQNVRLSREGRLEVRPGFTALSATTMSAGSLVAYDVKNFQGRLVALGDQGARGRATDMFEWVATAGKWRATAGADTDAISGPRLPQLTDCRSVGALPDQFNACDNVRCAAGGGYICAVVNYGTGGAGVLDTAVHIFDPVTNQTLFFDTVTLRQCDVVYAGTNFWIVGIDGNDDAAFCSFDPASSTALSSLTVDTAATTAVDLWATNFGTGWAYVLAHSTACTIKTKTSAGAASQTIAVASSSGQDCVSLAGNTAGTFISVAMRATATGNVVVNTYTSAGVLQAGPTTAISSTTVPRLAMSINGTGSAFTVMACVGGNTLFREYGQSSHAAGSTQTYYDARMMTGPVEVSGQPWAGCIDREVSDENGGTCQVWGLDNFLPQSFVLHQLAQQGSVALNATCKPTFSGTKLYMPFTTVLQDLGQGTGRHTKFQIFEFETSGTTRRQMAEVGGELLIAGALPLTYDGRVLSEQGFAERPHIESALQGTNGSLTQLATYNAICVWEVFNGKGQLLRSQASSPFDVTLTGSNDDITWTVTTPHSLRRHPAFRNQAISVRVSIYRTEAGEGVFFLDRQVVLDPTDEIAEMMTVQSTSSDANLIDNAVLYEQSQQPLSNVGPQPFRYVWGTRERAFTGGLPDAEQWAMSKLLFPGEPVCWASPNQLGFSGRVGQNITAVAAFETVGLVWSEQEVWQIPGRGPEHNGTGDFDAAAKIASPGGALDWRSVIVTPAGAFFQMRADRLMLLDRGSNVTWAGSPVQDTLASFPVVVGAVYVRELDQVVFAATNTGNTDAVFLVLDLSNGQWFVDTVGEGVRSVSELDGRLVYVNAAGIVKQQDATIALGANALPSMRLDTASFRLFKAGGWGDIERIYFLGTFLGACTLEAFISYDDGLNYTTMGSYSISGADYAVGAPVSKDWTPATRTTDRFRIRLDITNATNTGAIRLHFLTLEATGQDGTARLPSRDKR
jgi:hypothetical protein